MNDAAPPVLPAASPPAAPTPRPAWLRWALAVAVAALVLVAVAALVVAATMQQRVRVLERELVQRQQEAQAEAVAARALARSADDAARDAAAKVALLEARVAENTLQRSQFEELLQSLSRSRDENVVADIEAAIRVALQQSAITFSAEPLVAALQQTEERLARHNQPRLERVRRAAARDLDRVKAAAVADLSTLAIRLDEAIRQVDELPLLSTPELRRPPGSREPARAAPKPASAASESAPARWGAPLADAWHGLSSRAWEEVRSLVRVTRIDNPEAVLVAPEQAFFLRENLKLRLLNARLALLSRQFDIAQADLRDAQAALDRYFDRGSRRVVATGELVRQVASQTRQVSVPRPDETLAALAAAGR